MPEQLCVLFSHGGTVDSLEALQCMFESMASDLFGLPPEAGRARVRPPQEVGNRDWTWFPDGLDSAPTLWAAGTPISLLDPDAQIVIDFGSRAAAAYFAMDWAASITGSEADSRLLVPWDTVAHVASSAKYVFVPTTSLDYITDAVAAGGTLATMLDLLRGHGWTEVVTLRAIYDPTPDGISPAGFHIRTVPNG